MTKIEIHSVFGVLEVVPLTLVDIKKSIPESGDIRSETEQNQGDESSADD